jgi:hypothetical protein
MLCISPRVLRKPLSLKELEESIAVHQRLVNEIPEREAIFLIIRDQYGILCKLSFYFFVEIMN